MERNLEQPLERYIEHHLDQLTNCPLFANIEYCDLAPMLLDLHATVRDHHKDQFIYFAGEPAGFIGIVLSGQIQILQEDYDGNRNVLSAFGPQDIFAEAFAVTGAKTMPIDILSVTNSTILFLYYAQSQHTTLGQHRTQGHHKAQDSHTVPDSLGHSYAQFYQNVMQLLARKNMMLNSKLSILSHTTTQEKLMAFLNEQAKRQGTKEFDIPYDRQALADYLGVERSAMSTELGKLVKKGLIESHKNHFVLK